MYKAVALYYKDIIRCLMFLSFLCKKQNNSKHETYECKYKVFFILQKEKRDKEKISFVKRLTSGKIKKSKSSPDNEGADKISHTR